MSEILEINSNEDDVIFDNIEYAIDRFATFLDVRARNSGEDNHFIFQDPVDGDCGVFDRVADFYVVAGMDLKTRDIVLVHVPLDSDGYGEIKDVVRRTPEQFAAMRVAHFRY